MQVCQLKSQILIQFDNSRCRLVRNNYWSTMRSQQLRSPLLICPRKTARAVSGELYIIRRIGVDEITGLDLKSLNVFVTKVPPAEDLSVISEIRRVINGFVSTKRNVEIPALIEATQAIETRAI